MGTFLKITITTLLLGNAFVMYCMFRMASLEDAWMEAHAPHRSMQDTLPNSSTPYK